MKNGLEIDAYGNKRWYKDGEEHNEDGPAIEMTEGTKLWIKNGKTHRINGPAVEWSDGDKFWYINGELHREDGPAIEYTSNGGKRWFLCGKNYGYEKPENWDRLVAKIRAKRLLDE